MIQTLQGISWVTEAEGAGGYVKFSLFLFILPSWCFYHIVESIISYFGKTFRDPPQYRGLYWAITICNFMDSIREVMNWVIALRIQGPNKRAAKNMKRGSVKGRSHNAQLQILFQLPQEFASSSLLFMIHSLSCWPVSLTIPDWFT